MKIELNDNIKYQVVFVDVYGDWYLIGFFDNLADAEDEVNSYLEQYEPDQEEYPGATELRFGEDTVLGHLTEYVSTFNLCFDRIINTCEGCVEVRGFIFK